MARNSGWTSALAVSAILGFAGVAAFAEDPAPGAPPASPPAAPPTKPPAKPVDPLAVSDDEPELTGEAKDTYDKDRKTYLEALKNEKNKEIVRGTIGRLGASATRAGRDALMVYAAGNKNQEFATEAFNALAKINGKKAIEFLCGKYALKSGDFLVMQSAATALGEARSPFAVDALLEVLTSPSTKIELTGAVSRAVARTAPRDERVAETLFKLADGVKDTIRANAMEALGYLATDKAMERLKTALFDDKNTRVRGAAAIGMKNSARKDMIPVLERALASDKSMQVKDEIATALKTLEGR